MSRIDFTKYRDCYYWKIIETDKYIFHIEPSNFQDKDLLILIKEADKRYNQITELIGIHGESEKDKEKDLKYNYWIHNSQVAIDSGVVSESKKFFGHGCASRSGIDYVIHNSSWNEHIRHLLHEESHLIWICKFGEAPSILNEGIAVYIETLLSDGYDIMKERFSKTWIEFVEGERGLLRNLLKNGYFESVYGKIPVYTLGGMFVFYIINEWGIDLLKDIFSNCTYDYEELDELIEKKTCMSIESIELSVTCWIKRNT